MEVQDNDYILGAWIVSLPGVRDWMATVKRPGGDPLAPWRAEYRFRYYVDEKIWGSDDKKSFFQGELPPEMPEEAVEGIWEKMMHSLREAGFGTQMEHISVKGGPEAMIEAFSLSDMMHMKTFSAEEAEKYKGS